ncbi:sulfatase-like hydrolase/transferase [Lelliottia amnigena]|uniref:sulfatase-like hydrolase/transferase n=1 Tax=Lelliottia amnigena TaxID=61646 RepID=UPI001C2224FD|nr:sulfatase-like hydrolase/transferase [Lelliottia amnigena]
MSILFSQKSVGTFSKLASYILLIISMLIVAGVNILTAKYNAVINRTLIFLLIILTLKCINNKVIRNIFAVILLIPIAADISLQLYTWNNFNSAFSYGFAMSVLNTTPREASSMLGLYWRDCIILVGLSALFIYTVNTGQYPIKSKFRRWPVVILCLTLFAFFAQAYLHQIRKSNVESLTQRFVQATPVSTAKVFMQAVDDMSVVANIGANIPDYKLTLSETGIDNYVLIIGESERTANMSIYGYKRDTTPELIEQQQKKQLLLFNNAVSPAPVTIMAVPLGKVRISRSFLPKLTR